MYARRTEPVDAIDIEKLISITSTNIFGKPNIINIIEKSLLSVTLTSKDGEIIGYASFFDYPRISDFDSADDWNTMMSLMKFELANAFNSFFMHYFLSKKEIESNILMEIINTVFNTAPNIHYIFLNTDHEKLSESLSHQFKLIQTKPTINFWYGLKRESYMPTLFIRPAKPEDMDDLAPIFNAQSTILKEIYGEFYIAEMIAAQNETTKCLVAEVGGFAIGFVSVTSNVNVDILNFGYHVDPFDGFKKPIAKQLSDIVEINQFQEPISLSTEHSVPVVVGDEIIESSLSDSTSSKISSFDYKPYRFPSTLSVKSGPNIDLTVLPDFDGAPSAILIQLFAITEAYEMRSLDFLQHIFELFPDKDYLLITVPFLVPEFTLLDNFLRVTPRPGVILPHELYAFHKGCLIDNLCVRQACRSDQDNIENLIKNLKLSPYILQDLEIFHLARRYESGINLFVYLAECIGQIIGIAIIKQEENIEYIRSHYNIEDFIYFTHHKRDEHAHLKHFAINPAFKRLSKTFLKEVMRKSHKTSLYFPVYKPWAPIEFLQKHSLISNLSDLVPVRPRRQIDYDLVKLEENSPTDRILQVQEGYCLTHFNRKLTMEPKVTINVRIVVVGASTTGLSFLESLVFSPHLKFNNLFLVSPNGLPDYYPDEEIVEQLMGKDFYFSKKKLELSALRIQVNVIKGYMTAIDRKKKQIVIDKVYRLPYDHMIIATGLQYTIPCPTEAKIKDLPITKESPNIPSRRYSEMMFRKRLDKIHPKNLFVINDPYEAGKLIHFVRKSLLDNDHQVIVYGHSYESYCCLHSLLAMGIYGHRIHFVKPPKMEENYPLNNDVVENAVYHTFKEAGVSIYDNYSVAQFNDNDDIPSYITSVSFTTNGPPLRINCEVFISYYRKIVNYDAFRAMNDSCLVFDSRLVIDTFFHTNDISIRAAGPVTKFKRRYYSEEWDHSRFNSKTVGDELSKVFLRLFDPTLSQITSPPIEEVPLIPMYNDPILKSCILPGGYYYLNVHKPCLNVPITSLVSQPNYGVILTTGSPQSEMGYFRLHLNQYNKIETITCLRKKPYSIDNFIQLYGIHERALNNLQSRFNENLITDFFEYFNDTWAMAFYHDRFNDLKDEIKELFMSRPSPCNLSFEETVRNMMIDGVELTIDQKKAIMDEFRNSNAKTTVDHRLISFISYNYYHLPMYAKPDMV